MTRCIPCVEKKLRRLLTEEKAKNAELEAELAEFTECDGYNCCPLAPKLKALREAAQAVVDFVDGPKEEQRPDVFHLFINRLRALLTKEVSSTPSEPCGPGNPHG